MATSQQSVREGVHRCAVNRILGFIHRTHRDGRRIYPLTEISESTSIDLTTAESVMRELESTGPYDVFQLEQGEIRWRVEGCVYDLDNWANEDLNLD